MLLTVREAADRLRLSVAAVYELVARGKVLSHRVGPSRGAIRIREEDLQQFLESCRQAPIEPHRRPERVRLKHMRL